MLLVNPQQLNAEAERLAEASAMLVRAYDTVSSVSAALATQKPIDSAVTGMTSVLRKIEEQIGAVSRLSRALEQISSTYTGCERDIENNCTSSSTKPRIDALKHFEIPEFIRVLY